MQKLLLMLAVPVLCIACTKNHDSSSTHGASIVGKWNINTVTVIPFDSVGKAISNKTIYSEPSYYYFRFNSNNTWTEDLGADPGSAIEENGTYTLHGDSSFTLINTNAPSNAVECFIDTLTETTLVFTYRRNTFYNGITPGFLRYIFHLNK